MRKSALLWGFSLLCLLFVAGCDSTLNPIAEDSGVASIYGVLTLSEQPSLIRVENLNDPLVGDTTRELEAEVTLTNRRTGKTRVLPDSILVFDGVPTQNFQADFDVKEETTYQITVDLPSGSAKAVATTPESTRVAIRPLGPASCTQSVRTSFPNVSDEKSVRAELGIPWRGSVHWIDLEVNQPGEVPVTTFTPAFAMREVVPQSVLSSTGPPKEYCSILFAPLRIAFTHFGPDWPSDSVAADPFESRVENGLGLFGGIHQDTLLKPTITPLGNAP